MKVLIIDDDMLLVEILTTAFHSFGLITEAATDGNHGIQKASKGKFDVILIDQVLPDMRGNDILRTLKTQDETKQIPMLIFSNFGEEKLVQEALSLGAVEYILKYQVKPEDLVRKFNQILEK